MDKITDLIARFLIANGWNLTDNIDGNRYYEKKDNIGIEIMDNQDCNHEIVFLDDTGDIYHIPINKFTYNTMLGYMIKHRMLACDFKDIE